MSLFFEPAFKFTPVNWAIATWSYFTILAAKDKPILIQANLP